jgi:hypothetical protein
MRHGKVQAADLTPMHLTLTLAASLYPPLCRASDRCLLRGSRQGDCSPSTEQPEARWGLRQSPIR